MSVYDVKRKDAKGRLRKFWMVDVDLQHPDGRRERVRKVSPVNTKVGAKAYEIELRRQMLNPRPLPRAVPTFSKYAEDVWLPAQRAENHENTVEEKRSHLRHHLLPAFGARRLDEIDGPLLKSFFAELRGKVSARTGKPLTPKTIHNLRATLRRILSEAVSAGLSDRMPEFPKIKVPSPRDNPLTGDAADRVLASANTPEDRALLLFALRTGVRAGEQMALRWRDVDHEKGYARIWGSKSRGKLGPTKSGRERYVILTPVVVQALGSLPRRSEFVFTQPSGKAHSYGTLRSRLNAALQRAGIEHRRWHDLRHSFGTALADYGIPLAKVQGLMGHSSIATTMRYVHVRPDADLTAALDGVKARNDNAERGGNLTATSPDATKPAAGNQDGPMVGVTGFEPVTSTV